MAKIFALCNQKGGVGKTTTTVNIATCVALSGKNVLIIDLDPQGNATSGIGIEKNADQKTVYDLIIGDTEPAKVILNTSIKNLSIIPANPDLSAAEIELINEAGREFILKNVLAPIQNQYDFIFIDCPPSLGLLTLNALVASDGMIIPLQCEYYALEGLGQLLKTHELVKQRLKPSLQISAVIMTMADSRTNLTNQVIDEVRGHFHDLVFETVIPRSVKISEAPSFGKPVVTYDPSSKGATFYKKAAAEFLRRFGDGTVSTETESTQEISTPTK